MGFTIVVDISWMAYLKNELHLKWPSAQLARNVVSSEKYMLFKTNVQQIWTENME